MRTMPPAAPWRVEVEMQGWRGWHPLKLRQLRRLLGGDEDVVRVLNVSPWHLLLRSVRPTVTIEVVADSPPAAARCAERAVERSLVHLGQSPAVSAWIISTRGMLIATAQTTPRNLSAW
jgi:hypothetical protein